MALKNSNTVAVERRYDLASLFCMIGRHGPAVAMAIIAMLSMLAAFIIYRTVRSQWRKVTAWRSVPGAPAQQPGQEEESHSPVESTGEHDDTSLVLRGETEVDPRPTLGPDLDNGEECCVAATAGVLAAEVPYAATEPIREEPDPSSPPELRHRRSAKSQSKAQDHHRTHEDGLEETASQCHMGESEINRETVEPQACKSEDQEIVAACVEENVSAESLGADKKPEQEEEDFRCATKELHVDDDGLKLERSTQEQVDLQCATCEPLIQLPQIKDDEIKEADRHREYADSGNYGQDTHPSGVEERLDAEDSVADQIVAEQAETCATAPVQEIDLPVKEQSSFSQEQPEEEQTPCQQVDENVCQSIGDVTEESVEYQIVAEQAETWAAAPVQEIDLPLTEQPSFHQEQPEEEQTPCQQLDENVCQSIGDVPEQSVDDQIVAQQAETWAAAPVQEIDLPLTEQPEVEQTTCQKVGEHVCQSILDNGNGASHDTEEPVHDEVPHLPSFCEQLESEVKDDKADWTIPTIATERKQKSVANDVDAATAPVIDENRDHSCVVLSPLSPSTMGSEHDIAAHVPDEDRDPSNAVPGPLSPSETSNKDDTAVPVPDKDCEPSNALLSPALPPVTSEDDAAACIADEEHCALSAVTIPSIPPSEQPLVQPTTVEQEDSHIVKDTVPAIVIDEACDTPCIVSGPQVSSPCPPSQSEPKEDNDFHSDNFMTDTDTAKDEDDDLSMHVPPHLPSSNQIGEKAEERDVDGVTDVRVEDGDHPVCCTHLLPLGQGPQRNEQANDNDDDSSASPHDEDSGISSKLFSPHMHSASSITHSQDIDDEDISSPIVDEEWDLSSVPFGSSQQQFGQDTDDMPATVAEEGMLVSTDLASSQEQQPLSTKSDQLTEQLAANEDIFGHTVEDSYYSEIEVLSTDVPADVTNFNHHFDNQTEIKNATEPQEITEKAEPGKVDKKEVRQAKAANGEEEEEEDHEKTEINIMEATMDNNEWITDGNYQVLPWMSFSLPAYAQDLPKPDQVTTEEREPNRASATTAVETDSSSEAKDATTIATAISVSDEIPETAEEAAAVHPEPLNVNVTFRVHYLTHSPGQTVAVTGNQQELGSWKGFIPLEREEDGYWASIISLPAESQVEWKFVLVDEGRICRWEECDNRCLDTGHGDDTHMHKWWGLL